MDSKRRETLEDLQQQVEEAWSDFQDRLERLSSKILDLSNSFGDDLDALPEDQEDSDQAVTLNRCMEDLQEASGELDSIVMASEVTRAIELMDALTKD